jgi:prepilin signal peptidase PulO-like enzyme (type II secretory pathway)
MVYLGVTYPTGPPSAMISHADAEPTALTIVRRDVDGSAARARRRGAVIGLSITVIVWVAAGFDDAVLPALLLFVPAGVTAAFDATTGTLPDRWVGATAAGGLTWAAVGAGPTGLSDWMVTASAVALPVVLIHAVAPAAMGFGDVKYSAAIGGSLGVVTTSFPERVLLALTLLAVASAAALAYGGLLRRHAVRFGPCLLLGGGIATVLAVRGAITT